MQRKVRIIRRRDVFHRFIFRIEEVTFQHERFDGSMSDEMTRLVLQRGDSVAILLVDEAASLVLLCEQFRIPAHDRGPGWLLELPAGVLEPGETETNCAQREALEETGYSVESFESIARVYLSPGGSSERITILAASVVMAGKHASGGGVAAEGEDIRSVWVPIAEALELARRGEIQDAKTLIAVQWLGLIRNHGIA
jgi:ADP-ribose pyrophosphatase